MSLFIAFLILGGGAVLEGWVLRRRGQYGELWAMSVLTALTLAAFVVYELQPELLQSPISMMRKVFTPISDWILGR